MRPAQDLPAGRRLRANGVELHVVDVPGEPGRPGLVLLHGWPTSSLLWRKVVPALVGTARLVVPDLPGFGRSEKPDGFSYRLESQSDALGALLDGLGLERVVLVVHDLGGPIGLRWAVRNPRRVAGLVVLNTLFHPDGPARLFLSGSGVGPLALLRAEASARLRVLVVAARTPGLRRLIFTRALVKEAMRMGVRDRSALTRTDLEAYAEPYEGASGRRALRRTFLDPRWSELVEVEKGIGGLSCPARVVVGTADVLLPGVLEDMRRLEGALHGAALQEVAGCGHFVPEDRPDVVVEAIRLVMGEAGANGR